MVLNHALKCKCSLYPYICHPQSFSSPLLLTVEGVSNTLLMTGEESSTMKHHRAHINIVHLIKSYSCYVRTYSRLPESTRKAEFI